MNTPNECLGSLGKDIKHRIKSIESWWGEGENPNPFTPLSEIIMETPEQAEYEAVETQARIEFERATAPAKAAWEQARETARIAYEQETGSYREEFERATAPYLADRALKIEEAKKYYGSRFKGILEKNRLKDRDYPQHNETRAQLRAGAEFKGLLDKAKDIAKAQYDQVCAVDRQEYKRVLAAANMRYKAAIMEADITFTATTSGAELIYSRKIEPLRLVARRANCLAKMESIHTELLDIIDHL